MQPQVLNTLLRANVPSKLPRPAVHPQRHAITAQADVLANTPAKVMQAFLRSRVKERPCHNLGAPRRRFGDGPDLPRARLLLQASGRALATHT